MAAHGSLDNVQDEAHGDQTEVGQGDSKVE